MGRITAKIKVENLGDILLAEKGHLPSGQIRRVELEALVDTGATMLFLPAGVIQSLGLSLMGVRSVNTATGLIERRVYRGACLTILNRTCTGDVMELDNGIPALIGYVPLETLDLQPDLQNKTLGTNPEHGGKMVLDLF